MSDAFVAGHGSPIAEDLALSGAQYLRSDQKETFLRNTFSTAVAQAAGKILFRVEPFRTVGVLQPLQL